MSARSATTKWSSGLPGSIHTSFCRTGPFRPSGRVTKKRCRGGASGRNSATTRMEISMKSASAIPITPADLSRFVTQAQNPIVSASWRPSRSALQSGATAADTGIPRETPVGRTGVTMKVGLGETLLKISNEQFLPDEDGTHILHVFRRALQTAFVIGERYRKLTNMDELMRKKNRNDLTNDESNDYANKSTTEAGITVFVTAKYVVQRLSKYKTAEIADLPIELPSGIEVSLGDPVDAVQCLVFYLAQVLQAKTGGKRSEPIVTTGRAAVKM